MFKAITAALFAASVFTAATIDPGATDANESVGPQRSLKGDRLQIAPGESTCLGAARSHHENHCPRGRSEPAAQPRETRVAAISLTARHPIALNYLKIRQGA